MIIPKGEIVFIERKKYPESKKSPLIIRVGKTISLRIYSSALKISHPLQYYINNDRYAKAGHKRKSSGKAVSGSVAGYDGDDDGGGAFSIDDYSDLFDCEESGSNSSCYDAFTVSHEERVIDVAEDAESSHEAENIENSKDFTVLDLYPLKHNLAITVAASQGMTINTLVYGMISKNISAYNLIVMSTRSSSSDNIKFFFEDPQGVKITPLDNVTSNTIKRLVSLSNKCSGFL